MQLSQEYLNILVQQLEKIYKFSFNFGTVSFCSVQGLVKNNTNDGMDLVFLVGRSTSGGVFWGVFGLIMILGRLCASGWGCVPVLLVFWHRVSSTVACWSLNGAGFWCWDGDLWEIFTVWYYVELGGLLWTSVLKLALAPQRHSPDTWLEHQEPVLHTAQNKREENRKKERKNIKWNKSKIK